MNTGMTFPGQGNCKAYMHMRANVQVLGLLAQAYLLTKQPAPALQCMQAMQQLDKAEDTQPALHLIAIQANIMVSSSSKAPLIICCPIGFWGVALSCLAQCRNCGQVLAW